MKPTPEIVESMVRAGYRSPESNPLFCRNCPSVSRKKDPSLNGCFIYSSRFFCRRHQFYVHSLGYCPSCGLPFVEKPIQKPRFVQEKLFR